MVQNRFCTIAQNQHVRTPEHCLNTFLTKLGASTRGNIGKIVIFWDFRKIFGAKYRGRTLIPTLPKIDFFVEGS